MGLIHALNACRLSLSEELGNIALAIEELNHTIKNFNFSLVTKD